MSCFAALKPDKTGDYRTGLGCFSRCTQKAGRLHPATHMVKERRLYPVFLHLNRTKPVIIGQVRVASRVAHRGAVRINTIGIDHNLDRARIKKLLTIGLFASILTGIGDFLLGYAEGIQ